ncbi:hypothetical protein FRC06_002857 [Ceratobasidium sp. 370]|nr:hypothetical protein FRC06_002857 [Ceratobasidium sp. 370]
MSGRRSRRHLRTVTRSSSSDEGRAASPQSPVYEIADDIPPSPIREPSGRTSSPLVPESDASQRPPQPDPETSNRFYDYPGIPGVMTCSSIARYSLGIATHWNLLCCLKCPSTERMVSYKGARDHIKIHHPTLPKTFTKDNLEKILRPFNIITTNLYDVPTPQGRVAPLPFLDYCEVRKCELCEEQTNPRDSYFRSRGSRQRHFQDVHKLFTRAERYHDRVVWAQTFCPKSASKKKWFEVDPNFVGIKKTPEAGGETGGDEATAYELAEAFNRKWTPAEPLEPEGDELRHIMPFLYYIGWSEHVKGIDLDKLRTLVQVDHQHDPLRRIHRAAYNVFVNDQARIDNIFHVYRWNLMDDESGPPEKPFQRLTRKVAEEYAGIFGRFAVFVCRMRQMALNNNPFYAAKMTPEQQHWTDVALNFAAGKGPRGLTESNMIYGLASAFWHAKDPDYFDGIAVDQFSDLTARFACLINLREGGDFDLPRTCSSRVGHMKYIIRSALLFWSVQKHEKEGLNKSGIIPFIAESISRRRVTPFATIAYFVSHATTHANSTVAAPNVAWVSRTTLAIEGHSVMVKSYFNHIANLVRRFKKHIRDELLLGLDLSSIKWPFTEKTHIYDDLRCTRNNYSAFEDRRNDFYKFVKTLGVVFNTHPRAKHLYHHVLVGEKKEYMFRHDAIVGYIAAFNKANEMLGQILLLTGGQPGRIAELVELKYENTVGRLCGIVFPETGQAMYILSYSKGTSQMGKDRHIGHGIPWCVTDAILVLKGLVSPYVGVMMEELYGTKRRAIQEHGVLTEDGATYTADHFGDKLQAWFLTNLEIPIRP